MLYLLLLGQIIEVEPLLNQDAAFILQKVKLGNCLSLHWSGRSLIFRMSSVRLFLSTLLQCVLHLGPNLLVKLAIAVIIEGEVEADLPQRRLLLSDLCMALCALGLQVPSMMLMGLVQWFSSVWRQALSESALQLGK